MSKIIRFSQYNIKQGKGAHLVPDRAQTLKIVQGRVSEGEDARRNKKYKIGAIEIQMQFENQIVSCFLFSTYLPMKTNK